MRLVPKSLLWRTFFVIVILLALSIAAWIQIFRIYQREPRSQQVAQQVVAIVNLTRAALVSSRPEARVYLMREISNSERIEIYPVEADERLEPTPDRSGVLRIESLIREKTSPDTRFAFKRNGVDGLWVSFHIEDDEYWVRMRRDRLEPPFAWQWLGWGGLAAFLSLIGAYFLVLRITQPLRALADAAREVGRGAMPAPLAEVGASEISEVSHAFNQMARDLKAQDQNRALILAGISHDLRTPLARLRLGIEMSSDNTFRDGMVADIEQMDQVIGQFLDFARSGQDEAAPAGAVDLALLCDELRQHYHGLGRALDVERAGDPVEVTGRAPALRRALHNLIDNAFKYGGSTPVHLRCVHAGTDVHVDVLDRGPGVPPAEAERLKQPFTRLDGARGSADGDVDSAQGGSGLGLAIVERIARLHGGTLELLPRDGGGLCARLRLPAAPVQQRTESTTS